MTVRQRKGRSAEERDGPLFPPEQAFVVQFMAESAAPGGRAGRVEHVTSGRSARFDTIEGLFEFIAQVRRALGTGGPAVD